MVNMLLFVDNAKKEIEKTIDVKIGSADLSAIGRQRDGKFSKLTFTTVYFDFPAVAFHYHIIS